ncbi:MAG: DHH family phosphoesterase [Bacteroidaceae bacterium]|nr:DHH family phosphoesterase [Bacteroidaceae bacterium]MBP3711249.1 DHH family phosphoesterase [Bacteroidaceae bacterium]
MLNFEFKNFELTNNIVICTHVNPDGDAIGSSLALKHYLERKGKQATVIVPNVFPDFLRWLPGAENVLVQTNQTHKEQIKAAIDAADFIIVCDLNQPNRLAGLEETVMASQAPRILIDHHLNPDTNFCQTIVSHPEMCATAEVICHMLSQLGELDGISQEEATCLYCAMMCDTGAFSFNSNRPIIYEYISRLLAHGIDKDEIYRNVFWTASEGRLRLQGYLLYVNMKVLHDRNAAIITLTNEERRRFKVKNGDTEGIVNIPLQMLGTRLSIFINEDTEHPGTMKLSLRSVGDFPCDQMASRFFGGGGHKNASGGKLQCTMEEALEKVKAAIGSYADMLKV